MIIDGIIFHLQIYKWFNKWSNKWSTEELMSISAGFFLH